jgi:hypothetical protein
MGNMMMMMRPAACLALTLAPPPGTTRIRQVATPAASPGKLLTAVIPLMNLLMCPAACLAFSTVLRYQ